MPQHKKGPRKLKSILEKMVNTVSAKKVAVLSHHPERSQLNSAQLNSGSPQLLTPVSARPHGVGAALPK